MKQALLGAYGGTATTEAAVHGGLEWLAQSADATAAGACAARTPTAPASRTAIAATAMALLAFQGAGNTHREGRVRRRTSPRAGTGCSKSRTPTAASSATAAHHHRFYTQAQGTIALCELYGMTKDPQYSRTPAQRAVDYACQARRMPQAAGGISPGGTRHLGDRLDRDGPAERADGRPGSAAATVSDASAVTSTRPQPTAAAATPTEPGETATIAMTAEGLLCRQYLGWKRDDPRLIDGVDDRSAANLIDYGDNRNVYYWYYATQVAAPHGRRLLEATGTT